MMLKSLLVLVGLAVLSVSCFGSVQSSLFASESESQAEFVRFLSKYEKSYEAQDFFHRYDVFRSNLYKIAEHNSQPDVNFKLSINQFSDMTDKETKKMFGLNAIKSPFANYKLVDEDLSKKVKDTAESLDWREKNAVTSVKNQGQCGGCWAFGTTGVVEGAWAIKHGELFDLSEQQLLDCSRVYGNLACDGGLMTYSYEYLLSTQGLCTETDYPYTEADNGKCAASKCKPVAQIESYANVIGNSEQDLMRAVNLGPVAVAVHASVMSLMMYSSGVYDDVKACGTGEDLDHAVLLVGYGTQMNETTGLGTDYWIVKNSWGTEWGEEGYIRMARGSNLCGISSLASYVNV